MKTQFAVPEVIRPGLDWEKTETFLKSIFVPPPASAFAALQEELSGECLNNETITAVLGNEQAVTTELIDVLNAPVFGLPDKVGNIQDAIELLGKTHVANIANAISLKQAMCGTDYPEMFGYFGSADDCALAAAGIARELGIMAPDQAYCLGLLHDCGIPVLLQAIPNYTEVLQLAYISSAYTLTECEDHNLNINHAVVAYYICKTWGMSENIGLAILNHHNVENVLLSGQQHKGELQAMVALLTMAEYISCAWHGKAGKTNWAEDSSHVLDYLGLNEADFDNIKTNMFAKFAA